MLSCISKMVVSLEGQYSLLLSSCPGCWWLSLPPLICLDCHFSIFPKLCRYPKQMERERFSWTLIVGENYHLWNVFDHVFLWLWLAVLSCLYFLDSKVVWSNVEFWPAWLEASNLHLSVSTLDWSLRLGCTIETWLIDKDIIETSRDRMRDNVKHAS